MAKAQLSRVSNTQGEIERVEGKVAVRLRGNSSLAKMQGVTCLNARAAAGDRVYEKVFHHPNKAVFLPDEEDRVVKWLRNVEDVVTIGMTGYSSLKPEVLKDWGLKPGEYEAACRDILACTILLLQREYQGIRIKLTHGASDMGIDRAVIEVARKLNLDQLGFNCPKWMFYVNDDEVPVYVAEDQESYADAFVRNTDILISVGGREQSLMHDVTAAIKYGKCLIVAPVMNAISSNGGPPSRNGNGEVQDATQAFLTSVRMPYLAGPMHPLQGYRDLTEYVAQNASAFAQQHLLSPGCAFNQSKLRTC